MCHGFGPDSRDLAVGLGWSTAETHISTSQYLWEWHSTFCCPVRGSASSWLPGLSDLLVRGMGYPTPCMLDISQSPPSPACPYRSRARAQVGLSVADGMTKLPSSGACLV